MSCEGLPHGLPIVRWVNSILMLKREDRLAVVHYTERVISTVSGPVQANVVQS